MTTLALDQTTHDILIQNNTSSVLNGSEDIAQTLEVNLKTFRGECLVNKEKGIPYLESMGKDSKNLLDNLIKTEIAASRGVEAITEYNSAVTKERILEVNVVVNESIEVTV